MLTFGDKTELEKYQEPSWPNPKFAQLRKVF